MRLALARLFTLGGRAATAQTHDGWLVVSVPLPGDPSSLLIENGRLPTLAKPMPCGSLQVELPAASLNQAFRAARADLERAADFLESGRDPGPQAESVDNSQQNPALPAFITARREQGRLLLWTQLAVVPETSGSALLAVAHYLLALNGRLRFARGSVRDACARLEVVLPAGELESQLLDAAAEALASGREIAKKPVAALCNPELALRYLEFHIQGDRNGHSRVGSDRLE